MTVHERRVAVPAPRRRAGLSLVEVLVALAVVAVVVVALVGLQVTSLRAARTAAQTRLQAAALDLEADMARLVQPTTGACSGYSTGTGCRRTVTCLGLDASGACGVEVIEVSVEAPDGRSATVITARHAALEAAAVTRPPPRVEP